MADVHTEPGTAPGGGGPGGEPGGEPGEIPEERAAQPPPRPWLRVHSRAQSGVEAPEVTIEAHRPGGTSGFSVVGMAQTAVREARDRVKSAIKTMELEFPSGQLVVNLAPADLAKHGSRFDLAIAMSILAATRQIPARHLEDLEFIGELSLYGEVRGVRGCFGAAMAADAAGRGLVFPMGNARELGPIAQATEPAPSCSAGSQAVSGAYAGRGRAARSRKGTRRAAPSTAAPDRVRPPAFRPCGTSRASWPPSAR